MNAKVAYNSGITSWEEMDDEVRAEFYKAVRGGVDDLWSWAAMHTSMPETGRPAYLLGLMAAMVCEGAQNGDFSWI